MYQLPVLVFAEPLLKKIFFFDCKSRLLMGSFFGIMDCSFIMEEFTE